MSKKARKNKRDKNNKKQINKQINKCNCFFPSNWQDLTIYKCGRGVDLECSIKQAPGTGENGIKKVPPLNFRSNDAILYQNIYSLTNYKTQKIVAKQLSSRTLFCNSLKENEATKSQQVHTQENVAGTCATLTCSCYTFLCMHVPVMILSLLNITAKCLCNRNVLNHSIWNNDL